MKEVNACIITIGDELLIGQTIDTNSAWIACGRRIARNCDSSRFLGIAGIPRNAAHILGHYQRL